MIDLDTNVLIRYIAQDDEKQSLVATTLIEGLSVRRRNFPLKILRLRCRLPAPSVCRQRILPTV